MAGTGSGGESSTGELRRQAAGNGSPQIERLRAITTATGAKQFTHGRYIRCHY